MEISSKHYKHCDLLKIQGRVDSSTAPQLEQGLKNIMDDGRFKIVIDMSELEFMSSAGLRVLINAQKTCKRYNRGELLLAGPQENVYAALDLAGFTTLFRVFADVVTAVGNF